MKKVLAIIFLFLIGVGAFLYFANFSEGVRSGILMKISKKGVIFKTYEGQLNIGGFDQTNDVGVSNVWEFSIKDKDVLQDLNNALDNSKRVKLFYVEKYITLPWWGETKYFVTDIEELGDI